MTDFSRREIIRLGMASAAGLALPDFLQADPVKTPASEKPAPRRRLLRLAHLTDVHIQPELSAAEGFAACLHHVQSQAERPELILFGGDCIMDGFFEGRDRTKTQWDIWTRVLKADCSLPIEACIGNHDIWGWSKSKSGCNGSEAAYGKKWAIDVLGIHDRYRSFDRGGWHFIVLDSIHPHGESFVGKLDDEQFDWLAADLKKTSPRTPVLILSHIPILASSVFFLEETERGGDWNIPAAAMHIDARRLKDLFLKHPNVKCCLSGHLHLVDRVEYDGVTYLCDGAVCGNWWKGPRQEFREGYAMLNLYSDGSVEREYVPYGWKAVG